MRPVFGLITATRHAVRVWVSAHWPKFFQFLILSLQWPCSKIYISISICICSVLGRRVCHISMLSKSGNDAIKSSNHFYLVSYTQTKFHLYLSLCLYFFFFVLDIKTSCMQLLNILKGIPLKSRLKSNHLAYYDDPGKLRRVREYFYRKNDVRGKGTKKSYGTKKI